MDISYELSRIQFSKPSVYCLKYLKNLVNYRIVFTCHLLLFYKSNKLSCKFVSPAAPRKASNMSIISMEQGNQATKTSIPIEKAKRTQKVLGRVVDIYLFKREVKCSYRATTRNWSICLSTSGLKASQTFVSSFDWSLPSSSPDW